MTPASFRSTLMFAFFPAAFACSPQQPSSSCETGQSIACGCTDGRSGAQVCDADGHWSACDCTGGMSNVGPIDGGGGGGAGGNSSGGDAGGETNGVQACGVAFSQAQCATCMQGSCCV